MIDVAYAMGAGGQAGTQAQGGGFMSLLPFVALIIIFYFLLIRPQQKKAKEQRTMLTALKKGDKIITSGGFYGEITGLTDDAIIVEIAPKVRVKITRGSVAGKVN
jgi:preprotein translocase subunit YajC